MPGTHCIGWAGLLPLIHVKRSRMAAGAFFNPAYDRVEAG